MLSKEITVARELFNDEISLKVFDARVKTGSDIKKEAFPETLEFVGIDDTAKAKFFRFIDEFKNMSREKYIYGAGVGCKSLLEKESACVLTVSSWTGIIDNNVTGERYGLPVITFAEFLEKHKDALVLNSIGMPIGEQISKQCADVGIDYINLFDLDKSWNQYFDLPKEMGLIHSDEVFVHAGCYNGDTQKSYINWFGDSYSKIITFEPSAVQISVCKEKLKGLRDIEIVQAGLSDSDKIVRFDLCKPGSSFISDEGSEEIHVVALDKFMNNERVTFIALDIEGEESAALRGAEQIIKMHKPKLAISAYHKPDDIWELTSLIQSYRSDYKFYLRHYHLLDMAETVLYAF